jgi:hypothetical protein
MGCTEFQLQGIKKQDLDDFAQACQVNDLAFAGPVAAVALAPRSCS